MKAILKFTDRTIEKIRDDEIKDVQQFLNEMTAYRLNSVIKAAEVADEDAIYLLCEIAKAFAQKENGVFLTTEESVTYGKRLLEAMQYTANVRRGTLKQKGYFKLTDPTTVGFFPTQKGFDQANKMLDMVAKHNKKEKDNDAEAQ